MSETLKKLAAERRTKQKLAELAGRSTIKSPERMREEQIAYNKALAAECDKKGWGKSPANVPEKSRTPLPSLKGSCRRKTGLKLAEVRQAIMSAVCPDMPEGTGVGAFA